MSAPVKLVGEPSSTLCYHCGDPCELNIISYDEKHFCCNGCVAVYTILNQNNLGDYYCLTNNPGTKKGNQLHRDYALIDDKSYRSKLIAYEDDHILKVSFYLPQIHCSSCLYLMEHLHAIDKRILHSAVNFTEKKVYLTILQSDHALQSAANLLASLGYAPEFDFEERKKSSTHPYVIMIGVTGFCFANIMLLSFPEYFGLSVGEELLLKVFRFLNLGLSIPVFLIAAKVFFAKAYGGIKNKYVNIDLPVSLAIVVTFLRSMYEIFTGSGIGYLDSMSGIVFFMLIGRWMQDKTVASLKFDRHLKSYFPISVEVMHDGLPEHIKVNEVKIGDAIRLKPNEIISVDSEVLQGESLVDYSFITGESQPVMVYPGKQLFAGGKIAGNSIIAHATKNFSSSEFTQIWNNEAFKKDKSADSKWTDRLGAYFAIITIAIATLTLLYWGFQHDVLRGLNALTAALIVACPCALLLGSSYTLGFISQKFAASGLFLKNAGLIDQLALIDHIVFDKTGTLTHQHHIEVNKVLGEWNTCDRSLCLSLLKMTAHPFAQAVLKSESRMPFIDSKIDSYRDVPGMGIEGWSMDHHIKIGSADFVNQSRCSKNTSEVLITMDGRIMAHYVLIESIRKGIPDLIRRLRNYDLTVLSGDHSEAGWMIKELLPTHMTVLLAQKPQDKLDYIHARQHEDDRVLMVGDGLNDAGALKQSNIGLAVVDHFQSFVPACDMIAKSEHLRFLDRYLDIARKSKKLILVTFIYSILYNVIGLSYALTGNLKPLIAAILMPLSSIGVILIAYLGTFVITKKLNFIHT